MNTNQKIFIILLLISLPCIAQITNQQLDIKFTPAEVESMLFLYNQTTVKGSEVEIVAPVGVKLKAGLQEARALKDTTETITLKLNPTQAQVCLNIIHNSTFEAKYAELVLGMKRKLEKLFPLAPPPGGNAAAAKQEGDSK